MQAARIITSYAGAVISGVLLSFAYPDWNIEGFAWVWMIPLLASIWYGGNPMSFASPVRRAFFGGLLGFLAGAAFFLINLSWIHTVSSLGAIVLPLYLALYFALWGAFAATIGRPRREDLVPPRRAAAAPRRTGLFTSSLQGLKFAFYNAAAWTALEWLRGRLFTGFGWNGLGVTLHENLMLIQIADTVGVTGLSFMLMFCGCIATSTIFRVIFEFGGRCVRPHLDFAVTIIGVILVFFYGLGKVASDPGETLPVRALIVQMNIPVDIKWDQEHAADIYRSYDEFTSLYVETGDFDLVLWPETALPRQFYHPHTQSYLDHILEKGDFHLVLGIEEGSSPDAFYNSVALLRGNVENVQLYRKIHLVPFGEYIPLRKSFPLFDWVAGDLVPLDFNSGREFTTMLTAEPEFEIIPLVCFEDTLGRLVRRFVSDRRPQLIVNVTNDGWFLESAAAAQHLANARFRCVELRRPMARAANTGVSGIIDSVGSLYDRTGSDGRPRTVHDDETGSHFIAGCLPETIRIPRQPPLTFYARFGDLFSLGMTAWTALLVPWKLLRAKRAASAAD